MIGTLIVFLWLGSNTNATLQDILKKKKKTCGTLTLKLLSGTSLHPCYTVTVNYIPHVYQSEVSLEGGTVGPLCSNVPDLEQTQVWTILFRKK